MKTQFLENDLIENDEQRLIQMVCTNYRSDFDKYFADPPLPMIQAINLSKKQTCRHHFEIESAGTFYPSEDEFRDPLKYINRYCRERE